MTDNKLIIFYTNSVSPLLSLNAYSSESSYLIKLGVLL